MLTKVMFQYKDKRPHSNTKTTSYKVLASAASATKQSSRVELPYIDREGGRETDRPQKKRKKQNRRTIIRHAHIRHSKTRHNMQCEFCKFYKVKAKGQWKCLAVNLFTMYMASQSTLGPRSICLPSYLPTERPLQQNCQQICL